MPSSHAEADGRLRGDTVIEYTGGSTARRWPWVRRQGYRNAGSSAPTRRAEKLDQMAAYGRRSMLVRSKGGRTTKKLTST